MPAHALLFAAAVLAAPPNLGFDVPEGAEARDVTPVKWKAAHPDRKLIEITIPITFRLREGEEADLHKLVYEFRSLELGKTDARVVDFLPKTRMEELFSDGKKTVVVETEAGGDAAAYVGVKTKIVEVGGKLGGDYRKTTVETSDNLMPKALLSTAGTIERGTGVFFELKPAASGRESLQKRHSFSVIYDCPETFRAGTFNVICRAWAIDRGTFRSTINEVEEQHPRARVWRVLFWEPGDREAGRVLKAAIEAHEQQAKFFRDLDASCEKVEEIVYRKLKEKGTDEARARASAFRAHDAWEEKELARTAEHRAQLEEKVSRLSKLNAGKLAPAAEPGD